VQQQQQRHLQRIQFSSVGIFYALKYIVSIVAHGGIATALCQDLWGADAIGPLLGTMKSLPGRDWAIGSFGSFALGDVVRKRLLRSCMRVIIKLAAALSGGVDIGKLFAMSLVVSSEYYSSVLVKLLTYSALLGGM